MAVRLMFMFGCSIASCILIVWLDSFVYWFKISQCTEIQVRSCHWGGEFWRDQVGVRRSCNSKVNNCDTDAGSNKAYNCEERQVPPECAQKRQSGVRAGKACNHLNCITFGLHVCSCVPKTWHNIGVRPQYSDLISHSKIQVIGIASATDNS